MGIGELTIPEDGKVLRYNCAIQLPWVGQVVVTQLLTLRENFGPTRRPALVLLTRALMVQTPHFRQWQETVLRPDPRRRPKPKTMP